jgi:hypothetical protein
MTADAAGDERDSNFGFCFGQRPQYAVGNGDLYIQIVGFVLARGLGTLLGMGVFTTFSISLFWRGPREDAQEGKLLARHRG